MTNPVNFTKAAIGKLPTPPKGKRAYYRDAQIKGLTLQITGTGAKTFYCYRWVNGRPERIRLGAFPEMSIEQARKRATSVNGKIADRDQPE